MTDTSSVPTLAERLQRVAQIGRRHLILLVCLTAATAAAAVLLGAGRANHYSATAKLVLDDSQLVGVASSTTLVPNPDPERDINTKVALVDSRPVGQAVVSALHLKTPLASVLSDVSAQPEGTSNIVDVIATATTPAGARALANGFATEYVRYRRALARSGLSAAAASVRRQLAAPEAQPSGGLSAAALAGQLRDIDTALATQTGGASIVAGATQALGSGARPAPVLAAVGALVGLLMAAALVGLLELTNRTLKDGEDVVSAFGLPVLAEIPRPRLLGRRSGSADGGRRLTLAYDNLAGQVLLARRRHELRSVMVTSPGAGDGKTTVTMGVARALARLGHRVVIIQGGPGEDNRALRGAAAAENGSDPLISVLSPEGQETADGDRGARGDLGTLVESGRDRGDFVLIDGPSIHRLHGAPELTNVVDGVLLVARLRWTAKDSLRNTLDVLDAFAVRLLGLVLTDSVGLSTVTINARGAVIPLDIPVNGGDRYGASARRPRRAPTEVQTLTAGHVRASYDDGRAG